ncbi:MAG TPA: nucleotidyltransferase family protein [Candidatus Acidoferrales bacterium]|nr:nucleotidyltransferase family protein [Candidatus Acidoferrales bacterium]
MRDSAAKSFLSPEYNILTRCARRRLEKSDIVGLQETLSGPVDLEVLLKLADAHGLIPLLSEHSAEIEELFPPEFRSRLRDASRDWALRALLLSAELDRLVEEFGRHDIPAIPHKGPVLAARAYGNPVLRQFSDLDFAVPQRFMPVIFERMSKLDYEARMPRERFTETKPSRIPGEYAFNRGADRMLVEFHTERTLRYFPVSARLDEMIRRATIITVNGKAVPVFSREDELLMLAVHGAKDFWARLIWIADIAELVKLSPAIRWTELFACAGEMKAGRMLRLAIRLARNIVGLEVPRDVRATIEGDREAGRLATVVCEQLFANARASEGILSRSIYRIRSVEGVWSGIKYWMRLATAPAEEDWSSIDVPKSLTRSYSVLRPLRLWKKYGRSSQQSR